MMGYSCILEDLFVECRMMSRIIFEGFDSRLYRFVAVRKKL